MSKFSKITDQHLLNAIAKFPPDMQQNDSKRSFSLSVAVVKHFFDLEWVEQHISPETPTAGFLRVIPGEGADTQKSTFRIVDFAELLLNLQDVGGFDSCIDKMRRGNIEATYAELDLGRMLYAGGVDFRFVEPQLKKGFDYDVEIILPDGVSVCADAKCKIETTEFSEQTVMNSLIDARVKTQLTMLRFNGLVNRIGGPTDASELVLV